MFESARAAAGKRGRRIAFVSAAALAGAVIATAFTSAPASARHRCSPTESVWSCSHIDDPTSAGVTPSPLQGIRMQSSGGVSCSWGAGGTISPTGGSDESITYSGAVSCNRAVSSIRLEAHLYNERLGWDGLPGGVSSCFGTPNCSLSVVEDRSAAVYQSWLNVDIQLYGGDAWIAFPEPVCLNRPWVDPGLGLGNLGCAFVPAAVFRAV